MYRKYFLIIVIFLSVFQGFADQKKGEQHPKVNKHLSEANQRKFDYYFYEGLKLKETGKYDQALETFQVCAKLDSLDAGVHSELGVIYGVLGFTKASLDCMEKAVKIDPENWWYNLQLVSQYSELKKWDRCVEIAENLQKMYPNKEEVYTMQASFFKETKQFEKAIAAYNRLETLVGINRNISLEKFQLYLLLDDQAKGNAEIEKLINKFPSDSRYKVLRGDIYLQQKGYDKALETYKQVLKDDPQNALVYLSLSNYYKEMNQPENAMKSIVSALKSEQLDVDTKVQVLGQYIEKVTQDSTKLSETESLFKMLVDRYPMEEQVRGYYAVFLQFMKRFPEAVSEFESMININSKNDQTWMHLIQLNLTQKNFKQLISVADRAIKNMPKLPGWYFYKGIAEFQLNDFATSLASYKTGLPLVAAEQNELKGDFYAQIADTYYKLEKKDSAFVNYDKALEANPKNIMVMNNYAYYLSLEKTELSKAERMSAKTVELEPKNSTYLDTYAWILYQQKNYSLAKYYINRAIDYMAKDEESGVILEHYGDILWKTNDQVNALRYWQKSYDAGNKTNDLKKKIENKGM